MVVKIELSDEHIDQLIDQAADRKTLKLIPILLNQLRQEFGMQRKDDDVFDDELHGLASLYCFKHQVQLPLLRGKSRKRGITDHRFVLAYIMREKKYSLTRIGSYFNRDHTSIMHAITQVENLVEVSIDWQQRVQNAKELY